MKIVTSKVFLIMSIILLALPVLIYHRDTIQEFSVPYARPWARPLPQFIADGNSPCLPPVTQEMIDESMRKHAICRKFSPFTTGRARIATVTAHFGHEIEGYRKAFETHMLHSLIHGNEVRVMCDPIVDDLWNKPAFILDVLMQEMLKPEKERLEWIMWVDRDTMILDQCRPISSFLPPEQGKSRSWWRRQDPNIQIHDQVVQGQDPAAVPVVPPPPTEVNLLVTNDWNGLNNGIFMLRVNKWAVSLFTAILAFRHFKPEVSLPFTEQSAMEHVMKTANFMGQTQLVPQHWFNAYDSGGPLEFASRTEIAPGTQDYAVRRGDYLVHFAGAGGKPALIEQYTMMLSQLEDVWKNGSVQRSVDGEIADFYKNLNYVV